MLSKSSIAFITDGVDAGYFITPVLKASAGYYYQHGYVGAADGSSVLGRLAFELTSGVRAGVNVPYDEAFDTRVSVDLKVRFGGSSTTAKRKELQQLPVINALTSTPSNKGVRAHDSVNYCVGDGGGGINCIPGCLVPVPVTIFTNLYPLCIIEIK